MEPPAMEAVGLAIDAELVDVCDCGCAIKAEQPPLPLTSPPHNQQNDHCTYCGLRISQTTTAFIKATTLYLVLGVALRMTLLALLPVIPKLVDLLLCTSYSALFMMASLGRYYRKSILVIQMVWTSLETLCSLAPAGTKIRSNHSP